MAQRDDDREDQRDHRTCQRDSIADSGKGAGFMEWDLIVTHRICR